ncbi:MAG: ABC transporter substrate-binding protein [Candidatus Omnitrophica bacterium]|nr:ABC transporter substrate-binding protein [Candidatus Omnitrophota bacterium]
MTLKKISAGLFLALMFLPFAYGQTAPSGKYGGQLVLSTTSDPKSFNDIIAKETSTTLVTNHIFEGLTTTNAFTTKVEPHLAKRWEVSEDGLTWTFYLRDDVLWSDGQPFSADDVLFTFNDLIYNVDIPSSARDIFTIEGQTFKVEKINPYTVRFTLPVKFAPFLRGMGQAILPKHKLKSVVDNGRFNFTWGIDTPPSEIVGTGPFLLARYDPGQRLVFKRNPYYWKRSPRGDQLPYIDKIIYLIVPNQDVDLLKFVEGTTDFYGFRGMDYPLLKPLEQERDFTVYDLGPAMGGNFITFNQNPGINAETGKPFVEPHKLAWFTNVIFRRAAAHAIDKEKITEIVKNKLGYPQHSPIGPGSGFFYNPDVTKYDYDLDKSRQILAEAGFWDRDGDGIIEDEQGHKVEINLYTNSGNTERVDIAGIIRRDLEKVGMKVNFMALEFNTLVSKLNSTFEWDAIILGLTGGIEPHFGKNVWNSKGQLHLWHPRQESPATPWEARIDELFLEGVQELDENKRKVYYDEFQQIVSRQLPVIYTVLDAQIVGVRNKFENLQPTNYGGVFHNLEELYLKEEYR